MGNCVDWKVLSRKLDCRSISVTRGFRWASHFDFPSRLELYVWDGHVLAGESSSRQGKCCVFLVYDVP